MCRVVGSLKIWPGFHTNLAVQFSLAFTAEIKAKPLMLAGPLQPGRFGNGRAVLRAIQRWETKRYVREVMRLTGVNTSYGLEALLVPKVTGQAFVADERPRICDRMLTLGEPAVSKVFTHKGMMGRAPGAMWIKGMHRLAPKAFSVLGWPIWRLLDPKPLPFVEWHDCGQTHAFDAIGTERRSAWQVNVPANSHGPVQTHYVPFVPERPSLLDLQGLLVQLRRWELLGDLVAYDLHLQEAIRISRLPGDSSLEAVQPDMAEYLTHVFGWVHVPFTEHNLQTQAQRVEAGRQAWDLRQMVGAD